MTPGYNSKRAEFRGPYSKVPTPTSQRMVEKDRGIMFDCTSLDQWLTPQADNYKGLRVVRSIDPLRWQSVADKLLATVMPPEESISEQQIINLDGGDALIQRKFQDGARAVSRDLPPDLAKQVFEDAYALANATRKMVTNPIFCMQMLVIL
eukprot:gnl/MRDRNA2_/MRDRNA2_84262_c0_seq1.p1 gnl/MRDRNA2_/MRDRNA2_84262_c0~~gnl/MRDRNA2_/MRDRNA2_84262_c0_seq1.p1  ORF type:complete len:151 (-),score=21.01 gnl/MRDRNA2_/MRDRNA2_84262_c0_seq1:364-816(-)